MTRRAVNRHAASGGATLLALLVLSAAAGPQSADAAGPAGPPGPARTGAQTEAVDAPGAVEAADAADVAQRPPSTVFTAPESGAQAQAAAAAGRVVSALVRSPDGVTVARHEAAGQAAARQLIADLEARPEVVTVGQAAPVQTQVSDPLRGTQWALDVLEAERVWRRTTAQGTRIAIVDSGVDASHPDLRDVVDPGFDAIDPDGDGRRDTAANGHGTRVASVAGAEVDNGQFMAGLAADTRIVPVRALDGMVGDSATVASGVVWAADAGVDVINLSLGGTGRDPVLSAAVAYAQRNGALVVASAGNSAESGNPTIYPAAEPGVLAVGAVGPDLTRAAFSNYGSWLDLVAPGTSITVLCPEDSTVQCTDGSHLSARGTSVAAPHVAAAGALLAARYPRALPSQLATRLTASARPLTDPAEQVGAGLLNPLTALETYPDLGCRTEPPQTVARTWDLARVSTAAAVACTHWPQGQTAGAVLATSRDFPDALAGAALAAEQGVPLLLTEPDRIPPVLGEVLTDLDPDEVIVVGGRTAVASEVIADLADRGISVKRVAGANRYDTAARIAEESTGGRARDALLANGEGFADAVAAGAFQGADPGRPLLLTRTDRLPADTATAIRTLGVRRVTVVGGPAAVAPAVVTELESLGVEVDRLAGDDRYATSAAVVEALEPADLLIATTGATFPDALAAGALAGRLDGRVLLVPPEGPPRGGPTDRALRRAWEQAELIGGPAALSDAAAADIARILGGG